MLQCNIPEHSIEIFSGIGLTEEIKSSCIKKEIAGITVFYLKTTDFIQADFIYKNNLYAVKADTEDNLFRIIENLKEIS